MPLASQAKIYPHIGSDPKIADGKPIIVETRITVRCIAGYYQMGMSADEILITLQHLKPSQVHSALAHTLRKRGYDAIHALREYRSLRPLGSFTGVVATIMGSIRFHCSFVSSILIILHIQDVMYSFIFNYFNFLQCKGVKQ